MKQLTFLVLMFLQMNHLFAQVGDLNWLPVKHPEPLSPEELEMQARVQSELIAQGLVKKAYAQEDSIAVIGAGIAGLSTVRTLLEKGVAPTKITVFESRILPGGKTRGSFIEDHGIKRHFEMGAAVIIPGRYKLLEDLVKKHQLETIPLDVPDFFDVTNDSGVLLPQPTIEDRTAIGLEARYFLGLFALNPSWMKLAEADGYRNIPAELNVPWNEFYAPHAPKMEKLYRRLAIALGGSGFLMSHNPPFAAQVIRFINPNFLKPILNPQTGSKMFKEMTGPCLETSPGQPELVLGGFQCLWVREAHELALKGVKFKYGHRINEVLRAKGNEKVKLKYARLLNRNLRPQDQVEYSDLIYGVEKTAKFDHVFYTADMRYLTETPGQRTNQKLFLKDATNLEKNLYKSINIYPYKTYMVRIKNFPVSNKAAFFALLPQVQAGENNRAVLLMRTYTDSDIFQVWSYGDKGEEIDREILEKFSVDMKKIGAEVDLSKDVLAKADWDYFPHATPSRGYDLQTFFRTAMALQGMGGVWYTSEALGFGLTIEAYEQARAFASWFVDNKL